MAPSEKIPKPPTPLNDQSDWPGWSTIVTNALRGAGLLAHLTGSGPIPPSADSGSSTITSDVATATAALAATAALQAARDLYIKESSEWQLAEFRVMDYLIRYVGSGLTVEIGSLPSARAMWSRLTERFTECTGAREAYLLQCVTLQRRGDSSLQAHFGQMQSYWTELRSMLPGRTATYDDWLDWYERREVHQLFQTLPELSTMADQLLHQPQFPSLVSVMGTLTAHETRQQTARLTPTVVTTGSASTGSIMESVLATLVVAPAAARTSSRPPIRHRSRPLCTHCNKEGHHVETCFKLHPELRSQGFGHGKGFSQPRHPHGHGSLAGALSSTTSDATLQAIEDIRRLFIQHSTSGSISGFAGSSAAPSSSGTLGVSSSASPKATLLSEECLREKSISAIKEYYSAKDDKEVAMCIKELNAPSFYPSMVSLWVTDSFERKDKERDLLATLLVNLCKSRDSLLSQVQLIQGFESVLCSLEDAVHDAPKASEFLGRMFAKVIMENVVPLREIGRLVHEGGEERGRLLEIGLASEVIGSTLEIIRVEKGDSVLS